MGSDYAVLSRTGMTDREDTVCTVHRVKDGNASPWAYAEVQKIIDRLGPASSECHVSVRNLTQEDEEAVNLCLQGPSGPLSPPRLPGGSRIKVLAGDGDTVLFAGELARVAELNQAGTVRLIFKDDKTYLNRIPVSGSFVWDTESDEEKLVPRLPLRWNPEGRGNCLEIKSDGSDRLLPMFTHVSWSRADMEAEPYEADDEKVYPTFWTPARALLHLWYRMIEFAWSTAPAKFRCTPNVDTDRVDWPEESLAFTAGEMHKKLADPGNSLNAKSFGTILSAILDATGMYAWRLGYRDDGGASSYIEIVPRVPAESGATAEPVADGLEIEIQRAGAADDINTAYDFISERDYDQTITQIEAEGAPIEIEAELKYENGENDTLEPAWTSDEENAFYHIVQGIGGDNEHAYVDGENMDGEEGRPNVLKNTIEAVQLARAEFPLVWRAFRLKAGTDLDTILKGGATEPLADWWDWLLQHPRPLAGEEQCQRIFTEEDDEPVETDDRYQVRIQVDPGATGLNYHTTHANPGLRVTAAGLIFLDGLTDELAGLDNIYNGSLVMDPGNVSLRAIKINAVIPHDARIRSMAALQAGEADEASGISALDPNGIAAELAPAWLQLGTGPSAHVMATADIDHIEGFRLQYQVLSNPSARSSYGEDADGQPIEPPLNREYRSDQADLDALASKRFRDRARVGRVDQWRYIGIRPEFRAGTWINRIVTKGRGDNNVSRLVNAACVETVWHVVGAQVTEIKLEGF